MVAPSKLVSGRRRDAEPRRQRSTVLRSVGRFLGGLAAYLAVLVATGASFGVLAAAAWLAFKALT